MLNDIKNRYYNINVISQQKKNAQITIEEPLMAQAGSTSDPFPYYMHISELGTILSDNPYTWPSPCFFKPFYTNFSNAS